MATPTYDLIETQTLSSAASSVTFSNIDQSFMDLVLISNVALTLDDFNLDLVLNNDTTSDCFSTTIEGDGAAVATQSRLRTFFRLTEGTRQGVIPAVFIMQFMNYSQTDMHKNALLRYSEGGDEVLAGFYRYANNAAITSFEIIPAQEFIASGSTFSLYGIAA